MIPTSNRIIHGTPLICLTTHYMIHRRVGNTEPRYAFVFCDANLLISPVHFHSFHSDFSFSSSLFFFLILVLNFNTSSRNLSPRRIQISICIFAIFVLCWIWVWIWIRLVHVSTKNKLNIYQLILNPVKFYRGSRLTDIHTWTRCLRNHRRMPFFSSCST